MAAPIAIAWLTVIHSGPAEAITLMLAGFFFRPQDRYQNSLHIY